MNFISQKQIKSMLTYKKGHLHNLTRNGAKHGVMSGWKDKRTGYRLIFVNGKVCREHVLIWIYFNGEKPKGMIDHINNVRDDNRIENLRDVSHVENQRNLRSNKNPRSGVMGVGYILNKNKTISYRPEISVDGFAIKFPVTQDIVEAAAVRLAAEQCHGFDKMKKETDAYLFIKKWRENQ